MNQILIIVLSAIAALACAQQECDCGSLRTCVINKELDIKNEYAACHQNCKNQLGDAADQVQTCFKNKEHQLAPFEDSKRTCLFEAASGLCGPAPAQSQDNNTSEEHQEGRRVNQLDDDLLLYKACMKQCFLSKHPEHAHQHSNSSDEGGHKRHHRRHHGNFMLKKCAEEQKCTINKEAEKAAEKNCKEQSGLTKEFHQQVKKELCECLSNAFNIDPSEIACESSDDHKIEYMIIIVDQ